MVLTVLDGWGLSSNRQGNAIRLAKTPNFDHFIYNHPHTCLGASGEAVGLSWGEMGNSEVGHMNLGAGRVVWQDLPRITNSIQDGSFFDNPSFLEAARHVKKFKSRLHLIGLVSPGSVHSHIEHLYALLKLAKKQKINQIFIHFIADGRDSPPKSALSYLEKLNKHIKDLKIKAQVATVVGRYCAMDRDNHWERTGQAYDAIVWGRGVYVQDAQEAIETAYKVGQSDEFISPTVVVDKFRQPIGKIEDSDAVIFFNFRADRARQLNSAFTQRNFNKFPTVPLKSLFFVAFTLYENGNFIEKVAFPPNHLKNSLPEVISRAGFSQFHIAETEKYAHITYFFNGGREVAFPKEARTVVPSPRVATYDLKPEMSAYEIAIETSKRIKEKKYTFILVNFANGDMVGHTGNLSAAIKGIETVDKCLSQIYHDTTREKGLLIITADHGNAEEMVNPQTGEIQKDHSTNPVPLILASAKNKKTYPKEEMENLLTSPPAGILADVAPTVLDALSLPKPKDMEGTSLIDSIN